MAKSNKKHDGESSSDIHAYSIRGSSVSPSLAATLTANAFSIGDADTNLYRTAALTARTVADTAYSIRASSLSPSLATTLTANAFPIADTLTARTVADTAYSIRGSSLSPSLAATLTANAFSIGDADTNLYRTAALTARTVADTAYSIRGSSLSPSLATTLTANTSSIADTLTARTVADTAYSIRGSSLSPSLAATLTANASSIADTAYSIRGSSLSPSLATTLTANAFSIGDADTNPYRAATIDGARCVSFSPAALFRVQPVTPSPSLPDLIHGPDTAAREESPAFDEVLASSHHVAVDFLTSRSPRAALSMSSARQRLLEDDPEALAQALTSCRRALHALADSVFPPRSGSVRDLRGHDRRAHAAAFKNRLILFMSSNMRSNSSLALAEAELDHVSDRLDALVAKLSKGVHADVVRPEARHAYVETWAVISALALHA